MYRPRLIPAGLDLAGLSAFLQQELQNISTAQQDELDSTRLKTLYAAPSRIYEGMLVKADGTTWNPGSGAGIYARVSSAWVKL